MKPISPNDSVLSEINITPFCDVLLVLLIIFMILAALMAPPGFQKQMSSPGRGGSPPPCLHDITVEIDAGGRIAIDGHSIATASLYPQIASAVQYHDSHARARFCRHIALLADASSAYDLVIKVLDAARLAHDDDVGFVVQR